MTPSSRSFRRCGGAVGVPAFGAAPVDLVAQFALAVEFVDPEHRDLGVFGVPGRFRRMRHDRPEAVAVGDEIGDRQFLAAHAENVVVEPGLVDRRKALVVERLDVDPAHLDADLRTDPADLDHGSSSDVLRHCGPGVNTAELALTNRYSAPRPRDDGIAASTDHTPLQSESATQHRRRRLSPKPRHRRSQQLIDVEPTELPGDDAIHHIGKQFAFGCQNLVDTLLDRIGAKVCEHVDRRALADPVRPVFGLGFDRRVPPPIEMKYAGSLRQVQPQSAGPQRKEKKPASRIALELGDNPGPFG